MKNFKLPKLDAATIWNIAGGVITVVGLIKDHKLKSIEHNAAVDEAAEKAAKIVMEQLKPKN